MNEPPARPQPASESGCETAISQSPPTLRLEQDGTVILSGPWTLLTLGGRIKPLEQQARRLAARRLERWDLHELSALDTAGALLLWRIWGGQKPAQLACNPDTAAFLEHMAEMGGAERPPRVRKGMLDQLADLGWATQRLANALLDLLALFGHITIEMVSAAKNPLRMPFKEISANVHKAGTQALSITGLVGMLIGIVISYLSAEQLKIYGAQSAIILILSIGVTREMGPMLAAVLVAGRSGSAITAAIGGMRITGELDAMAVLGMSLWRRLVLPRVLALMVVMPLLTLWTDALGLFGGMVPAKIELDIGYMQFIMGIKEMMPVVNLTIGIGKSVVFGALIALVACHQGLRVKPNTESLGQETTTSVVMAITLVLVADAIFAVALRNVM